MSVLEIVGAAALYIVGLIVVLYLAMFLLGKFVKGGLEVLALMGWVAALTVVIGIGGGLFLLGWML